MTDESPVHDLGLIERPRRVRATAGIRALVRETHLSPEALVYPLFVCEGTNIRREVPTMPGVFQLSADEAVRETAEAKKDGVGAVLLFGIPAHKDETGSAAADANAPVQTAVRALRAHALPARAGSCMRPAQRAAGRRERPGYHRGLRYV